VSVTDSLEATSRPGAESFATVVPAAHDQVVCGVSFTPGTYRGQ
jgi:hypothetical protein